MIGNTKIRLHKSLAGIGALWIGATKKPKKRTCVKQTSGEVLLLTK